MQLDDEIGASWQFLQSLFDPDIKRALQPAEQPSEVPAALMRARRLPVTSVSAFFLLNVELIMQFSCISVSPSTLGWKQLRRPRRLSSKQGQN